MTLYLDDWTSNEWYSVISTNLIGAAGLGALYYTKQNCKLWFEALAGVSLLQVGLWFYASDQDLVDNSITTYADLALHIAGIAAGAFGYLQSQKAHDDMVMPPPPEVMPEDPVQPAEPQL